MTDSDNSIKSELSDLYRDFYGGWEKYFPEARENLEMHLGAHFTKEQYKAAEQTGRSLYPFNKTARQVDLIHGYEIRNRHILKIGSVERSDDVAASQHTGIIMQQMAFADGYDILSEAFKWGSLITGSNLKEIYYDREGLMRFARRPHNSFLLDPGLRNPDLSDCRNILTGQWLHRDNIKMLLPTEADKIDKIAKQPGGSARWDDRPNYSHKEEYRLYEEHWRLITEFKPYVISRMDGREVAFEAFKKGVSNQARAADAIIEEMRLPNGMPMFSKYNKFVRSVNLRIFVDGEFVWDGPNPTGLDEYNFVWLCGEWCPEMPREELKLRSLTSRLRAPQYARDKRLNQAIDIIEAGIQQGKRVREGALMNPEDAYKSGQGAVVFVKKDFQGALADAIDQFGGVDVPPGVFQLIEILDKEETETTGLNQEIFGSDDKDQPAILSRFRTGQALTAQGGLFQQFRRAKRQLGVKMVKLNQRWLSPQQVQRYVNQQPAPGFYAPDFTRFDCVPTEGLLTDSQRQTYYLELQQLYAMFPDKIPASTVIAAFPTQYPEELLKMVKAKEQMDSQMAQAQLQTKQALDNMMLAQARLDAAKTQSEVAGAGLDQVKTMTEAQKLAAEPRLAVIDKYIQLLTLMEQSRQAAQQPVKAQV
jgi:hypothetical protein